MQLFWSGARYKYVHKFVNIRKKIKNITCRDIATYWCEEYLGEFVQ